MWIKLLLHVLSAGWRPEPMRPGAHIRAAVEVLDEILTRHRPAATALADWGKSHRFAGSGDRAAIGNLVYDALRRRRSLAAQMQSDTPPRPGPGRRPARLGLSAEAVIAGADGSPHALEPLSEAEQAAPVTRASPRYPGRHPRRHPRLARPLLPARLRRGGRRGGRGAGAAGPGRRARQRPQGRPRARAEGARPLRRRSRPPTRRSACASAPRKAPAASPTSRPRPATARAGTRCRTRARRSPR